MKPPHLLVFDRTTGMPKESRLTENSVVNLQRIVVLQTVVIGVMAFLFRTGCAPVTLL